MTASERKDLRVKLLREQNGTCPVCGYDSSYCYFHARNIEHPGECKKQPVNVLEHNHAHCEKGCEGCIRGVVHAACNRFIAFIEANPQASDRLLTPWLKSFLSKGSAPSVKEFGPFV
jgi:hypothetical protein